MTRFLFTVFFLWGASAFAASQMTIVPSDLGAPIHGRKVLVTWVGASDGTFTASSITLSGLVVKVVTNPGSPAPTAAYDVTCGDPSDATLDVFGGALINRHTTTTEQAYPVITGATVPIYVSSCTLQITNNSVDSATGTIEFYVINP